MVLPSMLQEQNGPIKQALDTNEATTKTSQYSPILFATAGSKGVIQVWSTDKPHPLHSLEPLAKSHDLQECEETEGEEREMTTTPSTYVGLLHSQSLKMIAAVTYDHNITFLDTQFFQIQKQVRKEGREEAIHVSIYFMNGLPSILPWPSFSL